MSREHSDLKSKLSSEIAQFSSGKAIHPSMAIANARYKGHLKGALALEMTSASDPLDAVRNLLSAGDLDSAKEILEELSHRISDGTAPHMEPEILVDRARLFYFQGDYASTLLFCSRALAHSHTSVATRLTLLQIQLASQVELNQTGPAQRTVRLADSLREMLPHHPVNLYVDFLKIRLEAQTQDVESARATLRSLMIRLTSQKQLDPNSLHAYLRIRTELERLSGRTDINSAVACAALSKQIGDDLYHALDLIHLALACGCPEVDSLRRALSTPALRYEKVRGSLDEMSGAGQSVTHTAGSFAKIMKLNKENLGWERLFAQKQAELSQKTVFIFTDFSLVYDYQDHKTHSFQEHPRVGQLLLTLKTGEKHFFEILENLWGLTAYDSRKHGPLIRNLISRAKKVAPIPFVRSSEFVGCTTEAVFL